MEKEQYFYLYRHGQTTWNAEGRVKGQLEGINAELTPLGIEQMKAVREDIILNNIEAIFASDLKRTSECSNIINNGLNLPIYYLNNFRGLNTGIFQGTDVNEFRANELVRKAFLDYTVPIPGGESINDFISRIVEGLKIVFKQYNYNNVAIMTHVTTISNIKLYITNSEYEDIDYCVIKLKDNHYEVVDYGRYLTENAKIRRRSNEKV